MPSEKVAGKVLMNSATRYGLGVLAALLAVGLRMWLAPLLGDRTPYITLFATIMFAARYLGVGPATVTTLASALGVWCWLLATANSPFDRSEWFGLIAFFLFSSIIIVFGESVRRSKARQDRSEEALLLSEARLRLGMQEMQREIERRTAEVAREREQTAEQARLLDLANDAIFVRTAAGRISYWNEGAERLYGWTKEEALGRLTHELLHTRFMTPPSETEKTNRWEGELSQVKRDGTEITVASRWTTLRDRQGTFVGWLEINTDITARRRAEDAARRLSGRILSLQDDERRRIARELHDSLGQYLVSLKVNLDLLSNSITEAKESALVSECIRAAEECLSETRTISHLLHPPLLDEAGLISAARWYIEGFAERSGLRVSLEMPPDLGRLDHEIEITLFRILQEGLTNVHRHSAGSMVRVLLQADAEQVQFQISDNGQGIPAERLHRIREDGSAAGVGLAGMRERVRELGGSLAIHSGVSGTTITVTIPARQPARSSEHSRDSIHGASAA